MLNSEGGKSSSAFLTFGPNQKLQNLLPIQLNFFLLYLAFDGFFVLWSSIVSTYIIFFSMPNTKITSTYTTLSEVISFKRLTNVPKFAGPRVLKFNQIFLLF